MTAELQGGTLATSFFGGLRTSSDAAFCRVIPAFSGHASPGACADSRTFCVVVVSLRVSGDLDGPPWFRCVGRDARAVDRTARKAGPGPCAGLLCTRVCCLRGIQFSAHAMD